MKIPRRLRKSSDIQKFLPTTTLKYRTRPLKTIHGLTINAEGFKRTLSLSNRAALSQRTYASGLRRSGNPSYRRKFKKKV